MQNQCTDVFGSTKSKFDVASKLLFFFVINIASVLSFVSISYHNQEGKQIPATQLQCRSTHIGLD